MQPTYPEILFTTASGAGCGLLVLLGVFSASERLPAGPWFAAVAFGLALGAVTFGLVSSTFRPGRRDRARQALAQWRTSWQSRATVLATATCAPALAFAFGWIALGRTDGPWRALGLATALLAGLTVYATGMTYATVRPIQTWCNRWVVPNFLALALMTGALWLNALVYLFGRPSPDLAMVVVIAIFLAFYLKRRYWRLIDSTASPETAETGWRIAREHVQKLRRRAFLGLFAAPLLLSMAATQAAPAVAIAATLAAALSASAAVQVERWLFLAEAQRADASHIAGDTA